MVAGMGTVGHIVVLPGLLVNGVIPSHGMAVV